MKSRTPILVAAVAGLAVVAAVAAAAVAQSWRDDDRDWKSFKTEDIRKTLSFPDPAKPGEVAVDNIFGPVTVEGYAGNEVVLEARKIVYARDEARARKAEDEVRLDVAVKGNTIEAYVDGPFREKDEEGRGVRIRRDPGYRVYYGFRLKVPAASRLYVSTVTDGDVEVRGVEGAFDVRNVNGQVRVVDAAAAGDARTVNGGVTVVFRREPGGACLFKTVNGDVEVGFPAAPAADFRIETMNGEAYSDFDVTRLPRSLPVRGERRERDGKSVYRWDGAYGVRSGKGGPEIRLETLTGDVLIAKRSKLMS
jgi:hypothetical protein